MFFLPDESYLGQVLAQSTLFVLGFLEHYKDGGGGGAKSAIKQLITKRGRVIVFYNIYQQS